MPYEGDSFFTLSLAGRIGLVIVSAMLAALWLWATRRAARGLRPLAGLGIATLAFMTFEWLSPQVYYTYYMALLGVPPQLVIGLPPAPDELGRLLTFTERSNLSFHARGVLGWALILVAVYPASRARRRKRS